LPHPVSSLGGWTGGCETTAPSNSAMSTTELIIVFSCLGGLLLLSFGVAGCRSCKTKSSSSRRNRNRTRDINAPRTASHHNDVAWAILTRVYMSSILSFLSVILAIAGLATKCLSFSMDANVNMNVGGYAYSSSMSSMTFSFTPQEASPAGGSSDLAMGSVAIILGFLSLFSNIFIYGIQTNASWATLCTSSIKLQSRTPFLISSICNCFESILIGLAPAVFIIQFENAMKEGFGPASAYLSGAGVELKGNTTFLAGIYLQWTAAFLALLASSVHWLCCEPCEKTRDDDDDDDRNTTETTEERSNRNQSINVVPSAPTATTNRPHGIPLTTAFAVNAFNPDFYESAETSSASPQMPSRTKTSTSNMSPNSAQSTKHLRNATSSSNSNGNGKIHKSKSNSQSDTEEGDAVNVITNNNTNQTFFIPASTSTNTKFCQNCGTANTPGYRFCSLCGLKPGELHPPNASQPAVAGTAIEMEPVATSKEDTATTTKPSKKLKTSKKSSSTAKSSAPPPTQSFHIPSSSSSDSSSTIITVNQNNDNIVELNESNETAEEDTDEANVTREGDEA